MIQQDTDKIWTKPELHPWDFQAAVELKLVYILLMNPNKI